MSGAFAVSFHGLPRFTNDADASVWLQGTGKTAENLRDAFAEAGYRVELKRGDFDDPITGVLIIEDRHRNRVDLILGIRGMDPAAVERSVMTSLLGAALRVIGVEDLIAMKLFAGSAAGLSQSAPPIWQANASRGGALNRAPWDTAFCPRPF